MKNYIKDFHKDENVFHVEANWFDKNVSIEYPFAWHEIKAAFNEKGAFLRIEKGNCIIMFCVEIYKETINLDNFVNWYCSENGISSDNFIESGVININDLEALWYLLKADDLIDDYLLDKTIITVKENYVLRLHLVSDASEYVENEKEFLSIAKSLFIN